MGLSPIYEPLRFDWMSLIQGMSDPAHHESVENSLGMAASPSCNVFTLCMSPEEHDTAVKWARSNATYAGKAVEYLLERAPRRIVNPLDVDSAHGAGEFPPPVPVAVVTTDSVAGSFPRTIGRTRLTSVLNFPYLMEVDEARSNHHQVFSLAETDRQDLWTSLVAPFGNADAVYICDPYLLKKACLVRNEFQSGLAFFLQKFGELSKRLGTSITLRIMSGSTKDWTADRTEVQQLADSLMSRVLGQVRLDLRVAKYQDNHRVPVLHARYMIASQGGVEVRVIEFTDSVLAEAQETKRESSRVVSSHVYVMPRQILTFTDDWNRAKRFTDFRVTASTT